MKKEEKLLKPVEGQMPKQDTGQTEAGLPKMMSLSFGEQGVSKMNRLGLRYDFDISVRERYVLRKRHPFLAAVQNAIVKQVKKVELYVDKIDSDKPINEETKARMEAFAKEGFGEQGEKEFRARFVDTKKWYGDSFAELVFDSQTKEPLSVNYLLAETMRVLPNEHGQIIGYPQVVDGVLNWTFAPENIMHIKEHQDEYSFFGFSDIDALYTALLLDILADEYNSAWLENNASPAGAIVMDDDIDPTDLARLRWQYIIQLRQNPNRPVFINRVKQWIPMGLDMKDMDWQELHRAVKEKVMMVYGVLPMQVAVVETGKLANPEQQLEIGEEYIRQELEVLQNLYNLKLTPHFLNSENLMFKFKDLDPKLDALKKEADVLLVNAQTAKTLSSIPNVYTVDEIRAITGHEKLATGGDLPVEQPTATPSFGAASPDLPQTNALETKLFAIHKASKATNRERFMNALDKIFAKFTKEAVKQAKEHYPKNKSVKQKAFSGFEAALSVIISALHEDLTDATKIHTTVAYSDAKKALGFSMDKGDEKAILELLKDSGTLDSIKDFSLAQREGFKDVMQEAFDNNLSLRDMVKEMRNYSATETYKLERVARTETNRFANQGRFAGYQDLEDKRGEEYEYEWVGPDDERTTEICTDIKAGNPYSLDAIDEVTEGGEPHINCRHNVVRVVK